jgi:hypothetical protein
MSEGTPIDALESGEIANEADSHTMAQILSDINASGAEVQSSTHAPPMQPTQPMGPMMPQGPPMYNPMMGGGSMHHMMQPPQNYIPVHEDDYRPKKKTNGWSSALEFVRDPIFVALLVFVVSLPVLHTTYAKYASWAFAVGGQLSWLGLISLSVMAGVLFGLYKGAVHAIGG